MINSKTGLAVLVCLLCALYGCQPSKRPFVIVQVCLRDEQNLEIFIAMMQSIAQSEQMSFIDNSAVTQKDLASLNVVGPNYRAINIAVERKDGMGLGAGNLGLHQYEIALGFSEGANSSEAHEFSDLVVAELKRKWHVGYVPPGQGAFPMKSCE